MNAIKEVVDDSGIPLFGGPAQSAVALEICRGVVRLLIAHGLASVAELPLPNGRRADLVALSDRGEIWIVEIKSCLEDYRTDQKWPEYRDYADRLFFAVEPRFPVEIIPEDTGLILADRYGGEIVRPSPECRLAGARRKSMTLLFARAAAGRLSMALDPTLRAANGLADV